MISRGNMKPNWVDFRRVWDNGTVSALCVCSLRGTNASIIAFPASDFGFAMNVARTAVLAVLSVIAARPASAQTFQERWWSPIPRADAAEKPLRDQDKTIPGINRQEPSQQQVATPPDRSHSHARVPNSSPQLRLRNEWLTRAA
jgi:hypothetical protein